jgi:ribosome biogenesis GTPase A
MKDENVDRGEMAIELIEFLKERYPGVLADRYEVNEEADRVAVLEEIAHNRKCLAKGGNYDLEKAAILLLDDFRSGKIGCITLEFPE